MQLVKTAFSALALAGLLTACGNVDFKKTKSGVPYKIFSDGKGEPIRENYVVKFQIIQKVKDSVVGNTYENGGPQFLQIPSSASTNTTGGSYADIAGNVLEIMSKARKGDSIYLVQKVDSLIKVNPTLAGLPFLKKGGEVITTIRIVDFYKTAEEANTARQQDYVAGYDKMQADRLSRFRKDTAVQALVGKDNAVIEAYLKSKNIQTEKTPFGVYIQTLAPGQGPKPKPGQWVNVKYSGSNLQGQVFDAGVYPLQYGMQGAIPGFEEGVGQIAKGGKARIFIPSILGYGPQGSPPKVQPNQILVFDMEVLEISDKPIQPQMQPMPDSAHQQH